MLHSNKNHLKLIAFLSAAFLSAPAFPAKTPNYCKLINWPDCHCSYGEKGVHLRCRNQIGKTVPSNCKPDTLLKLVAHNKKIHNINGHLFVDIPQNALAAYNACLEQIMEDGWYYFPEEGHCTHHIKSRTPAC